MDSVMFSEIQNCGKQMMYPPCYMYGTCPLMRGRQLPYQTPGMQMPYSYMPYQMPGTQMPFQMPGVTMPYQMPSMDDMYCSPRRMPACKKGLCPASEEVFDDVDE